MAELVAFPRKEATMSQNPFPPGWDEKRVREVIERIAEFRTVSVEQVVTAEEKMVFKLPKQLEGAD
jgi:hypothetical protein